MTFRSAHCAFLACTLLAACSSKSTTDGGGGDGTSTGPTTASHVTLPSLTGDCGTYLDNQGSPKPFDWSKQPLIAHNCSTAGHACLAISNDDDPVRIFWMIDVTTDQIGQPVALGGALTQIDLQIENTHYGRGEASHAGQVQGTLHLDTFDPAAGTATLRFEGVRMGGSDSVYSFPAHCAVDGTLSVAGFAVTPGGARCGTDHECGGTYSGKVCDDSSFVCASGCHTDTDCPLDQACDPSAHTCAVHPGAYADEVTSCQKTCHDLSFFKCVADEAGCKGLCASEPRAKVEHFLDCSDGQTGACSALASCIASL